MVASADRNGVTLFLAIAAICAVSSTAGAATLSQRLPHSVSSLLRDINNAEPISESWLTSELAAHLECSPSEYAFGGQTRHRVDCDARDVAFGRGRVDKIDFRLTDAGSILIVSGVKNECVPISEIIPNPDSIDNGCTDGATCIFAHKRRRWVTVSVALPPEVGAPQCATQVIFRRGI